MNIKERLVAAIENGTVIDHIPAEKTNQVVALLELNRLKDPVTIGLNYPSKKLGKKGIIKVSDKFFTDEEISRLSVVAPNVVLSIIRNYEVVEKKPWKLQMYCVVLFVVTILSALPIMSPWLRISVL